VTELRNTGISIVGQVPWGTHLCCFYETKQDLLNTVVPYFKAGLESREFCLWVVSNPDLITVAEAKEGLAEVVPDLHRHLSNKNIEILSGPDWYLGENGFDLKSVTRAWDAKLKRALALGYEGMRVSGDTFWLEDGLWRDFMAYEKQLKDFTANLPITLLCTYALMKSGAAEILDVVHAHHFAILRQQGKWEVIEAAKLEQARTEEELKGVPGPIRVLLVDDHALVRAGIRALAERIDGVEVVAEAGNVAEALRLIKELKPDLVLLDISMPEASGFEVLAQQAKEFPEVRVIVLTVHEAEAYAIRALRHGAAGFLLKSAASVELKQAIETVTRGATYVSPELSKKSLLEYGKASTDRARLDSLSPRQREILKLVADGLSTKEIAGHLKISGKTVETHRAQLMERLNIHDVAGLVRFAIKMGLVDVE
jgi:DNA-binding NarL/FixJ family response regulator